MTDSDLESTIQVLETSVSVEQVFGGFKFNKIDCEKILKGMWYLKKVASLCEQLDPISTYLRPKFITFSFLNLGNGRKDKNRRRWTIFSFVNKKTNFW